MNGFDQSTIFLKVMHGLKLGFSNYDSLEIYFLDFNVILRNENFLKRSEVKTSETR